MTGRRDWKSRDRAAVPFRIVVGSRSGQWRVRRGLGDVLVPGNSLGLPGRFFPAGRLVEVVLEVLAGPLFLDVRRDVVARRGLALLELGAAVLLVAFLKLILVEVV